MKKLGKWWQWALLAAFAEAGLADCLVRVGEPRSVATPSALAALYGVSGAAIAAHLSGGR